MIGHRLRTWAIGQTGEAEGKEADQVLHTEKAPTDQTQQTVNIVEVWSSIAFMESNDCIDSNRTRCQGERLHAEMNDLLCPMVEWQ